MSYRVGNVLISKDIFALTVKMPEFNEVMHSWWIWEHLQQANVNGDFFGKGLPRFLGTVLGMPHSSGHLSEMVNVKSCCKL